MQLWLRTTAVDKELQRLPRAGLNIRAARVGRKLCTFVLMQPSTQGRWDHAH